MLHQLNCPPHHPSTCRCSRALRQPNLTWPGGPRHGAVPVYRPRWRWPVRWRRPARRRRPVRRVHPSAAAAVSQALGCGSTAGKVAAASQGRSVAAPAAAAPAAAAPGQACCQEAALTAAAGGTQKPAHGLSPRPSCGATAPVPLCSPRQQCPTKQTRPTIMTRMITQPSCAAAVCLSGLPAATLLPCRPGAPTCGFRPRCFFNSWPRLCLHRPPCFPLSAAGFC